MFSHTAQVTMFMIVGLMIVIISGGMFFLMDSLKSHETETGKVRVYGEVYSYIEGCMENQASLAIRNLALSGGYFEKPLYYYERMLESKHGDIIVPYYLIDGTMTSPNLTKIVEQLAYALQYMFVDCYDMSQFPYNITIDEDARLRITVTEDTVHIEATLPVTVVSQETVAIEDAYYLEIPTHLKELYDTAMTISQLQHMYGDSVCHTCLSNISAEHDVSISIIDVKHNNTEDYTFIYTLNKTGEEFNFAHLLNLSDDFTNKTPNIEPIGKKTAYIGELFETEIHAAGDDVTYYDNSPLFDIDVNTGQISFMPDVSDKGTYLVEVTVEDTIGRTDWSFFELEVTHAYPPPTISYIPHLYANVGHVFSYPVLASSPDGFDMIYTDDSSLFTIHPDTGEISFIPLASHVGEHTFTITVVDTDGNYAVRRGVITVAY